MAKINQLKQSKSFDFSQKKDILFSHSVEKIKKKTPSLSNTLLKEGKLSLLKGDKRGIQCFDIAAKLDPENYDLFIEQGIVFFKCGKKQESDLELKLANQRFKTATRLNPRGFRGWYLWGKALYFLGKKKREHHYFLEALKKYQTAIEFSEKQRPDVLATFYWNLGDLWNELAEQSGELIDYQSSIQAYQKASTFRKKFSPQFWLHFGNRYEVMGKKTNDVRFFVQSIHCLKKGVSIKPSLSKGWFFLGKTLKTLYSYTHNEDHFSQANDCFATAIKFSKTKEPFLLEWARLFLESGILFKDSKKIKTSIDLCAKALDSNRKDPATIILLVEALALFGIYREELKPIHEALEKIEPLFEMSKTPDTFYAYGMCLYALGAYYKDLDYYYQALEKFQEGLSMNRAHDRLWNGMALSSFNAALIDRDEKNYRRSLHFFEQALYLNQSSLCQFNYALCLLKYGEISQEKEMIELAVAQFEQAIGSQKNSYYVHLDWLFHYACALTQLAHFLEHDSHYIQALNLLNHILTLEPDFPHIHSQLGSTYSHYAELNANLELFERSFHHFQIAHQKDRENDQVILEWGLTLLNLGDLLEHEEEGSGRLREGEYKMIQAAKLGNSHAFYGLACLYSVTGDLENSLKFLEKASAFDALPLIEELFEDDWLENLRETKEFQNFIKNLESKSKKI